MRIGIQMHIGIHMHIGTHMHISIHMHIVMRMLNKVQVRAELARGRMRVARLAFFAIWAIVNLLECMTGFTSEYNERSSVSN
jgi:hypothetical protein